MNPEQVKATTEALKELSESYVDVIGAVKSTANAAADTKKLWREGNKSRLIKIGLVSLIGVGSGKTIKDNPISETIGACFIAAGAVQKGIKSRAIYLEDITKTFKSTLHDVLETSHYSRV